MRRHGNLVEQDQRSGIERRRVIYTYVLPEQRGLGDRRFVAVHIEEIPPGRPPLFLKPSIVFKEGAEAMAGEHRNACPQEKLRM